MIVHSDAKSVSIPVPDMSALIARLEAGEIGSVLDEAISDALCKRKFRTCIAGLPDEQGGMWMYEFDGHAASSALRVTASLDAALALAERVLPGYEVSVAQRKPRHLETCAEWWHASLFKIRTGVVFGAGPGTISIKSATPAVALCIAILKAKAQGEGG